MKETLERIQVLQDLAGQIEQLHRDKEMLQLDVRNREQVLAERKRSAEQTHQQRVDAAKVGDATQLKIEKAEQEIEKLNAQLNVTKHQKEYDAIRKSILSHQADVQKWEDEELASLQTVDELSEESARIAEQIAAAQGALEQTKDEVSRRSAELDCRIRELADEHSQLREQIRPAVLSAYERLSNANLRDPLATVKKRVCQGCFTQITKQTEIRLLRGSEIVYCHSCGRMLLLPD
jgi:predicted  nucleic acid-binding Zn-ribbon protein